MGLSRNKVAVSEGAAGSPPFYGEPLREERSRNGSAEARRPERVRKDRKTQRNNKTEISVLELLLFGFKAAAGPGLGAVHSE